MEDAFQPCAGFLAHPDCLAPPAARRLIDQLSGLFATDASGLGELVGERVGPLSRQRDCAKRSQTEALERIEKSVTVVGHAVLRDGAGGAVPAWTFLRQQGPDRVAPRLQG